MTRKYLILIGLGIIFIFLAILSVICMPLLVINIIHEQLQLEPNTQAFKLWKDIPIPIYQKFYIFNVTNPMDIERFGAKPILTEMGPFTYRSKWHKTNLIYHKNGTISYKEVKTYHLVSDKSIGDESDVITSLNGPLAITLSLLQKAPSAVRVVVTLALDAASEGFFIKRTVKQILFDGYPDLLTSFGPLLNSKIPSNNNGKFAWLYGRNDTDEGMFTVFTGKNNMDKLNLIHQFKGKSKLDYWAENSDCNSLSDATNGQMFAPIKTKESIYLFHPDFCRRWKMNFTNEINRNGLTAYRYTPDDNLFKNEQDFPPHSCFTSHLPVLSNPSLLSFVSRNNFVKQKKIRFNSGVFDLSACKYGAPILMSFPHFLHADNIYLDSVEGLHPNASEHEFYLDIEPNTGTSVGTAARIQVNVFINKPPGLFRYRNIPEIVFPVFWQELSVNLTQDLSDRIAWAIEQPTLISSISSSSMFFIGVLLVFISLLFSFLNNYNNKSQDSGNVCQTHKNNNSQVQVDDAKEIITSDSKDIRLEERGIVNKALDLT